METIQAMVNPRLLTKAHRLFTGTLQGRIIEILQNARRAGARQVSIINRDGTVHVNDNGRGIDDFNRLLDLGSSGWDSATESSEDPAGVGVFCLAPREVVIRSKGRQVTITDQGWTGEPVIVTEAGMTRRGTSLEFTDEPWTLEQVQPHAVFSGMEVTVDGKTCERVPFVSDQAVAHPELGCTIEVLDYEQIDSWHRATTYGGHWGDNVLVNFHGQVVPMRYHAFSEHRLHFMLHMTGEPTGIRLMLPARTRLVENDAFAQLKAALELEAYRFLQRKGHHRLPYKEWQRARELGVKLPESDPVFKVGLLHACDQPEPVEVTMPEGFSLAMCYRFDPEFPGGAETDEANVHLLAALGTFEQPFVPVSIHRDYLEYSWARQLPTITQVELEADKRLQESCIWCGELVCVESLIVTAHTSDGRSWSSPICLAVGLAEGDKLRGWWDEEVLVTPEAQSQVTAENLWYHLGGYSDDGDTYDTQSFEFEKSLDEFWARLVGPYEQIRRRLMEELRDLDGWKSVTLSADGCLKIRLNDGSRQIVKPSA